MPSPNGGQKLKMYTPLDTELKYLPNEVSHDLPIPLRFFSPNVCADDVIKKISIGKNSHYVLIQACQI